MWSRIVPGVTAGPLEWERVDVERREAPPAPSPAPEALDFEAEAARREREARALGFREGQASGRQEAAAAMKPALERLARAAGEVAGYRPKLRREAEEDVVKLALAIARRIVHRELNSDPEALAALVRVALERLDRRELVRIRMHPEETELVRAHVEKLNLPSQVEVTGDAALERGAAVFETTRGEVDASAESQLREIQRGLMDRLAQVSRIA